MIEADDAYDRRPLMPPGEAQQLADAVRAEAQNAEIAALMAEMEVLGDPNPAAL